MIPQLILLLFLGIGISKAYSERNQSPGHRAKFQDILIFCTILISLLIWGGFFDVLITKLS